MVTAVQYNTPYRSRLCLSLCLHYCVNIVCAGLFEDIPLGSAYARDEDDWDVRDKTFSFATDNDVRFFRYVA